MYGSYVPTPAEEVECYLAGLVDSSEDQIIRRGMQYLVQDFRRSRPEAVADDAWQEPKAA
jgi:hypothetical protein